MSARFKGLAAIAAAAAGLSCLGAEAQVALPAPVEQAPLAKDPFATGILSRADGALDADLWRGADLGALQFLLEKAPSRPAGPALGEAMRRVLLSSGTAPDGAEPALGGAKLLALARAGFIDEAQTVASLSNAPRNDATVAQALAVADLLDGDAEAACRRNANLSNGRDDLFWVKLRVLCYALAGERDAADLTVTLLREQGGLGDVDDSLLTALASGYAPKAPVAPETALHLAALRQLELPLAPGLLARASGGVLKAVAGDESLEPATRIDAAARAAAMGVLTPAALKALYAGVAIDVAEVGRAADIAAERPNDPLTDVIVYQAVSQMTAPEFLRDKASYIETALSIANTFPRAYAASVLYADDIGSLDGALLPAVEAGRFALARMTVGDGGGAARWLFAMLGADGAAALNEESGMTLIELTNLLAVLDPISAEGVAEAAGVSLASPAPVTSAQSPAPDADGAAMARILEAAFDAAVDDVPGQAGLAALAASDAAPLDDAVAAVVINQSLRAAGLNNLRSRMAFEAALQTRFANAGGTAGASGEEMAGPAEGDTDSVNQSADGPTPRLKPPAEE